ncbi:MAG TPA: hypothetical protein VJG90_01050 [Candidatus Nanoarchaeia archaeon]|nr:hypothetical protein [Candidatus Nanoarchaeia archaeon]
MRFRLLLFLIPLLLFSCTFDPVKNQLVQELSTPVLDYTVHSQQAFLLGGAHIQMKEETTVKNGEVLRLHLTLNNQRFRQAEFQCTQTFEQNTWQECTCRYVELPSGTAQSYNCQETPTLQACEQPWYNCQQPPPSPDFAKKQSWLQALQNSTFTPTHSIEQDQSCYRFNYTQKPTATVPTLLCFDPDHTLARAQAFQWSYRVD